MKISTKSRYALRGLLDLIEHYNDSPVQIKEIAKRQKLSIRYLENLFTALRAAGILGSQKGKGGGFYLNRDPEDISVFDIIKVVEGEIALVDCVLNSGLCERATTCPLRKLWEKASSELKKSFCSISLKEMINHYMVK